jgi:hypothetical protein
MKFAADRPYADPEKAARKLLELANAFEQVQDGRSAVAEQKRRSIGSRPKQYSS